MPGSELEIGEIRLRVTTFTSPCEVIRGSFLANDSTRISQKRHAGWSRVCARVLSGGIVRLGDDVHLIQQHSNAG